MIPHPFSPQVSKNDDDIKSKWSRRKASERPSSISSNLIDSKFPIDKLNFSNFMDVSDLFLFDTKSNTNASFHNATLSSKAKTRPKTPSKTAGVEVFYLKAASNNSNNFGSRVSPFPINESEIMGCQPKEIESSLWGSPCSNKEDNGDSSHIGLDKQKDNSGVSEDRKDVLSALRNQKLNDFDTVRKLKETIHKLQLKDAVQRMEIVKLKRINSQMQKDCRTLEEKVHSLERIKNKNLQTQRSKSVKGKQRESNSSMQQQGQIVSQNEQKINDLNNKSTSLMKKIEEVTIEKLKLEQVLKNVLFNHELQETPSEIDIKLDLEIDTYSKDLPQQQQQKQQPQQRAQTPGAGERLSTKLLSRILSSEEKRDRLSVEKKSSNKGEVEVQVNKQGVEKKVQEALIYKKIEKKREPSPIEKIFSEKLSKVNTSGYQDSKKRPSEIFVTLRPTPRSLSQNKSKLGTPKVGATSRGQISPIVDKSLQKSELDISVDKSRRISDDSHYIKKFIPPSNDVSMQENNTSIDMKKNFMNDSGLTSNKTPQSPGYVSLIDKARLAETKRVCLEDKAGSDKEIDISSLNNVSPAVLGIIAQYQCYKKSKMTSRNSSISYYNSKESSFPLSVNENQGNKVNFELLFPSNGREKENRKEEGIEKNENIVPNLLSANMINIGTILNDAKWGKKEKCSQIGGKEILEHSQEDKIRRQNPLKEIEIAHKNNNMQQLADLSQSNLNGTETPLELNELSARSNVCPIILSAQPQARQISSKRAQIALETLRAKMQKREI